MARNGERRPVEERFWEKVERGDPDGCWPWRAARDPDGYGLFKFDVPGRGWRYVAASRVAWALAYGDGNLPTGRVVRHSCDRPECCNPAHLSVGTVADNNRDTRERGRHRYRAEPRYGSENGRARLAPDDVREIRSRAAAGESYASLARRYGITDVAARNVALRRTWKSVA